MSAVPDWIKVGPLVYSVQANVAVVRERSDASTADMDGEWAAYSDHDQLVIGLNPDQAPDAVRRDLLHEILHCCLRVSGAEPNQYATVVARAKGRDGGLTVEEVMVSGATLPLLGVLRDNPDFVRWLQEDGA